MIVLLIFRFIIIAWVLGIIGILLYKISTGSMKTMRINVLFLFPISMLTRKGREKIKGELK